MALASCRILIADDGGLESLAESLTADDMIVTTTESRQDCLHALESDPPDVLVGDMASGFDREMITQCHRLNAHIPIILVTPAEAEEQAIEGLRRGAFAYRLHPIDPVDAWGLIRQAVTASRLMTRDVVLSHGDHDQDALIGHCPAIQDLFKQIRRFGAKPGDVLIVGEPGTGKQLVARAIHQHSQRQAKPLLTIHCAATPETTLESKLFGHEPGAFAGAKTRRIGRFEQAIDGTLFLDEIGDLSPTTQSKLLRVLKEKTIQRLGGSEGIAVRTRVIAATNRNLDQAMKEGRIRPDLYYRLSAQVVTLPPLSSRREDIPDLVSFFLHRFGTPLGLAHPTVTANAMECLKHRPWPGNVRELQRVVHQALLAARGTSIGLEEIHKALIGQDLPHHPSQHTLSNFATALLVAAKHGECQSPHAEALDGMERELLRQALVACRRDLTLTAKTLGLPKQHLIEHLRHHSLLPGAESRTT